METALEHILTNSYKAGMINFLEEHPEAFDEAVMLAISDKQPYSKRAAWLLWSCISENDHRIRKYIDLLVKNIADKDDDHQRELIKILSFMALNEENESFLFDRCSYLWKTVNKKPSVRFTAFKFIIKTGKKHPELRNEIEFMLQEHYLLSLSAAAKKSVLKMSDFIMK